MSEAYRRGYEDGVSGREMTLTPDMPQELQETYRDGYLAGLDDKAKQEAKEEEEDAKIVLLEPPYGGALGTGYEGRENPYDMSTWLNKI
ncbi:TPA: hypothetical protein TVK19_001991 [Streptococcus equi subsp. zooepidemicus]|nr:hypothetical protein [Streptococcus equi subsp. zooepidemicus]